MSLKKNYIKNSFLNVSGWAWLAILNIITTPYIFHKLGYEQYGILSLVLMVLGYFAFLDFGLGAAVIKFVAHYNTFKDYQKINRIISSILLLFFAIGILGGILLFIFSKYFAVDLFKISSEYRSKALYCFYISAFGFFLNLIFAVISKIPEAVQRYDVCNVINVFIGTFVNLANVITLFLGYGLKELVIVNLLGTFLGIIIYYVVVKRIIPEFKIFIYFSLKEMKEVFGFGLYTVFTKFSGVVSQSINQLIIGIILGPAGITIINIPSKLVGRFQGLIFKIASVVFPLTSNLYALNDLSKIENVYLKLSRYVYIISSLFFIVLIAYSKSILSIWLGSDFAQNAYLPMIIISVALFIVSTTMVPSIIAVGMGRPKYNAIFSFVGTITNILFVYPLTKYYGVTGSAFSFLLCSLNSPFFIFFINKKIFNLSNCRYYFNVFSKVNMLNICFLIVFFLLQTFFIHTIFSICIVIFISEVIMMVLFYRYGLYMEDRQAVKIRILRFINKERICSTWKHL